MTDYVVKPIGRMGQRYDDFKIRTDATPAAGSTFKAPKGTTNITAEAWAVYHVDPASPTLYVVPWFLQHVDHIEVEVV